MLTGFHLRARSAGGLAQGHIETCLFHQEDRRMIVAEAFTHQVHRAAEYRVQVQSGGDKPADLGSRCKIFVLPLERLFGALGLLK